MAPDETAFRRSRHLLERCPLTERLFTTVRSLLEEKLLLLECGTIVDAAIIATTPSTKNAVGRRDTEMKHAPKGRR